MLASLKYSSVSSSIASSRTLSEVHYSIQYILGPLNLLPHTSDWQRLPTADNLLPVFQIVLTSQPQ